MSKMMTPNSNDVLFHSFRQEHSGLSAKEMALLEGRSASLPSTFSDSTHSETENDSSDDPRPQEPAPSISWKKGLQVLERRQKEKGKTIGSLAGSETSISQTISPSRASSSASALQSSRASTGHEGSVSEGHEGSISEGHEGSTTAEGHERSTTSEGNDGSTKISEKEEPTSDPKNFFDTLIHSLSHPSEVLGISTSNSRSFDGTETKTQDETLEPEPLHLTKHGARAASPLPGGSFDMIDFNDPITKIPNLVEDKREKNQIESPEETTGSVTGSATDDGSSNKNEAETMTTKVEDLIKKFEKYVDVNVNVNVADGSELDGEDGGQKSAPGRVENEESAPEAVQTEGAEIDTPEDSPPELEGGPNTNTIQCSARESTTSSNSKSKNWTKRRRKVIHSIKRSRAKLLDHVHVPFSKLGTSKEKQDTSVDEKEASAVTSHQQKVKQTRHIKLPGVSALHLTKSYRKVANDFNSSVSAATTRRARARSCGVQSSRDSNRSLIPPKVQLGFLAKKSRSSLSKSAQQCKAGASEVISSIRRTSHNKDEGVHEDFLCNYSAAEQEGLETEQVRPTLTDNAQSFYRSSSAAEKEREETLDIEKTPTARKQKSKNPAPTLIFADNGEIETTVQTGAVPETPDTADGPQDAAQTCDTPITYIREDEKTREGSEQKEQEKLEASLLNAMSEDNKAEFTAFTGLSERGLIALEEGERKAKQTSMKHIETSAELGNEPVSISQEETNNIGVDTVKLFDQLSMSGSKNPEWFEQNKPRDSDKIPDSQGDEEEGRNQKAAKGAEVEAAHHFFDVGEKRQALAKKKKAKWRKSLRARGDRADKVDNKRRTLSPGQLGEKTSSIGVAVAPPLKASSFPEKPRESISNSDMQPPTALTPINQSNDCSTRRIESLPSSDETKWEGGISSSILATNEMSVEMIARHQKGPVEVTKFDALSANEDGTTEVGGEVVHRGVSTTRESADQDRGKKGRNLIKAQAMKFQNPDGKHQGRQNDDREPQESSIIVSATDNGCRPKTKMTKKAEKIRLVSSKSAKRSLAGEQSTLSSLIENDDESGRLSQLFSKFYNTGGDAYNVVLACADSVDSEDSATLHAHTYENTIEDAANQVRPSRVPFLDDATNETDSLEDDDTEVQYSGLLNQMFYFYCQGGCQDDEFPDVESNVSSVTSGSEDEASVTSDIVNGNDKFSGAEILVDKEQVSKDASTARSNDMPSEWIEFPEPKPPQQRFENPYEAKNAQCKKKKVKLKKKLMSLVKRKRKANNANDKAGGVAKAKFMGADATEPIDVEILQPVVAPAYGDVPKNLKKESLISLLSDDPSSRNSWTVGSDVFSGVATSQEKTF